MRRMDASSFRMPDHYLSVVARSLDRRALCDLQCDTSTVMLCIYRIRTVQCMQAIPIQ